MPIDTVTEIDSAWLDLNSIQVCFEKVFTLAQTRLDRSQFAFGIFWAFRHVQIAFDLHRTDLFIFRFVFLLCQRSTATFIVYSRSIVLIRFWKRGFVFVWIAIIQFNHGLEHPSFRSNCLYFKHYRKASKVSKNTSCARDGGREELILFDWRTQRMIIFITYTGGCYWFDLFEIRKLMTATEIHVVQIYNNLSC